MEVTERRLAGAGHLHALQVVGCPRQRVANELGSHEVSLARDRAARRGSRAQSARLALGLRRRTCCAGAHLRPSARVAGPRSRHEDIPSGPRSRVALSRSARLVCLVSDLDPTSLARHEIPLMSHAQRGLSRDAAPDRIIVTPNRPVLYNGINNAEGTRPE